MGDQVEAAVAVSARNKEAEGGVWLQSINWGFPSGEERPIDTKRVGRFAKLYGTELTGFAAYLGGAVAQEVIKKTGKFTPIDGWMHHEDNALIPAEADGVAPAGCAGTRYDDYISVLGADFIARAADQRVLLGEGTALSTLPLIFSYKSEKSLCGAATSRSNGRRRRSSSRGASAKRCSAK